MPDAANSVEAIRIQCEERAPDVAILRIRKPPSDVIERLGAAFGLVWPRSPNKAAADVFCVGPHEWIIVGRRAAEVDRAAADACEGLLHHVAHVGEGRQLWRIEGPSAPDLLCRGAAIDFDPKVFAPGAAAFTQFAQVAALLSRPSEGLRYDLIADASYTPYLNQWFERAVRDL